MGGRFLNKRFQVMDGFTKGTGDGDPAVFFEGDTGVVNRPLNVEGVLTATSAVFGSMTTGPLQMTTIVASTGAIGSLAIGYLTGSMGAIGSLNTTVLRADTFRSGSSGGAPSITAIMKITTTWNMGAITGLYGTVNNLITTDVAFSGAAVGDWAMAAPITSLAKEIHVSAVISSANNVQLRAWATGTTGAYTPGNVDFDVIAIKI